jgi:tRNA threonylcarbamoyladenosine biosynthesis protein TsaE
MNTEIKKLTYSLDQLDKAVDLLKQYMDKCSIFTFTGDLGAGKTTLVKALLRSCGVTDTITSPTFSYVNRYTTKDGKTFYHFDLYRVDSVQTFHNLGLDEYLSQESSWAFIEWPGVIDELLSDGVCRVELDYDGDQRVLKIAS